MAYYALRHIARTDTVLQYAESPGEAFKPARDETNTMLPRIPPESGFCLSICILSGRQGSGDLGNNIQSSESVSRSDRVMFSRQYILLGETVTLPKQYNALTLGPRAHLRQRLTSARLHI